MTDPTWDPVDYIVQTRDSYRLLGYEDYRWVHHDDTPPWAPLAKPLAESTLTVIASGGVYATGQVAFHHKDDVTFRRIPSDVDTDDLRISHFAYDTTNARRDPNAVLPIDTLRRAVANGRLGALTSHALTFMGGIYSTRRVRETLIPGIVEQIEQMGTDVVLLVPV